MHVSTPPSGNTSPDRRTPAAGTPPARRPGPAPGTRLPDRSPGAPEGAHSVDNTGGGGPTTSGLTGVPAVVAGTTTLNAHVGRLYSLLLAIRRVNRALLTTRTEKDLYDSVCESIVTVPGVRFVWVGRVDREKREVRPVAQAGFEEGYLSTIKLGTDELPEGLDLAGAPVRTGRPSVVRYAESDRASAPWRAEALRRGYRSSVSLPIEHEREIVATLNVYSEDDDAFGNEELPFLVEVTGDMGVGLRSLRLEQRLEHSLAAVERMVDGTVQAISLMGEMRDPYTAGHQRRVAELAVAIGKAMGLSADVVQGLHIAGLLHDVGKIAVPAEILSKPGKISDYEFAIIKSHPGIGKQILQGVQFPWPVAQAVVQHHERLDGRGYPDGLKGDAIIREARILAVSDVVEAMSSHRPYRAALGIDKALEEILRGKGVGYDAQAADACVTLFREGKFAFDEGGGKG